MNRYRRSSKTVVVLTLVSILSHPYVAVAAPPDQIQSPPPAQTPSTSFAPTTAENPTPVVPTIGDISLAEGQTLWGEVIQSDGTPIEGASVRIAQSGRATATVTTSQNGLFAVPGVRPGVYEIATGTTSGVFRVWSAGTAPPVASTSVRLVADAGVVRAQREFGSLIKNNKLVFGGIIAAAIAIPVAVHNSRLDRTTTSP